MTLPPSTANTKDLPKITTGTSEEYKEKAYAICARAILPNPSWKRYLDGRDMSEDERLQSYISIIRSYHGPRAEKGAFIVEAGNWSACALWWPPHTQEQPPSPPDPASEGDSIEQQTIWSKYGDDFWQLGMIGRDVTRESVPGAVRAVVQPFLERAAADGKVVWLQTTSEHAKDIYLHFGFQVVKETVDRGLSSWAMILLPTSQEAEQC